MSGPFCKFYPELDFPVVDSSVDPKETDDWPRPNLTPHHQQWGIITKPRKIHRYYNLSVIGYTRCGYLIRCSYLIYIILFFFSTKPFIYIRELHRVFLILGKLSMAVYTVYQIGAACIGILETIRDKKNTHVIYDYSSLFYWLIIEDSFYSVKLLVLNYDLYFSKNPKLA